MSKVMTTADGYLKPCPFCGKHPVGIARDIQATWGITCQCCGAVCLFGPSKSMAVASWNNRAEPAKIKVLGTVS